MPTKHTVKIYKAPAFYHVYNRASGERQLFRDDADRTVFMTLLQKYLAENKDLHDPNGIIKTYEIEIIAYCLMGSHFHLLLFQQDDPEALTGYMRSLGTAYSMYYNKKYGAKGHVFQSSYRASYIDNEAYLAHITRYIHLNPRNYHTWQWSSYPHYLDEDHAQWVHPERVLETRQLGRRYEAFVAEYAKTDRRVQDNDIHSWLAI